MPKVESTILDYTKSVEELRLFELSEKCREIAHEYEVYNIQNGIYENCDARWDESDFYIDSNDCFIDEKYVEDVD